MEGRGRDRPPALAVVAHRLFGWALVVRIVLFDALWSLPRQPVTYFVSFAVPRFVQVYTPTWYGAVGHFFDGDSTPATWAAALLTLLAVGGLQREVLWPSHGPGSRLARFLSVAMFVISPAAWAARGWAAHLAGLEASARLRAAFPLASRDPGHFESGQSAYSLADHVFNAHGGLRPIEPDITTTYKTVKMDPNASTCDAEDVPGLPGDSFFLQNRAAILRGILDLDVYRPPGTVAGANLPIVLHIHGGGWKKGDRSFIRINYHGGMPHKLLEKGFMIVSVSYRLSCAGSDPREMVDDIRDAIAFVEEHAASWGGDGAHIIPWGTSAGGNLALNAAFKYRPASVVGVISHYGVTELRASALERRAESAWTFAGMHSRAWVSLTRHVCMHRPASVTEEACFEELSPIFHATRPESEAGGRPLPPTLLIHGYEDPLVFLDQALWLQEELDSRGVPHALVPVHGSHDCDCHVSSACAQSTWHAVERFTEYLAQRAPSP